MRNSARINSFKAGFDLFKLSKPDSPDEFRKLAEEIFSRISDKSEHVNYLLANCDVAKRQNILFPLNNCFCCSPFSVFFFWFLVFSITYFLFLSHVNNNFVNTGRQRYPEVI